MLDRGITPERGDPPIVRQVGYLVHVSGVWGIRVIRGTSPSLPLCARVALGDIFAGPDGFLCNLTANDHGWGGNEGDGTSVRCL